MKKVIVLKEMPFAKVGDIIECISGFWQFGCFQLNEYGMNNWIEGGWLEWVEEEKSLMDKILIRLIRQKKNISDEQQAIDFTIISRDHTLEVFDKAFSICNCTECKHMKVIVRTALENIK